MYIKRPELLEEIRKSILTNSITYIYGYAGSGKTTICKECLHTYFSNMSTYTIYPYTIDDVIKADLFEKGIYVFEDYDYEYREITTYLKYISFKVNCKFILLSRKKIIDNMIKIVDISAFPFDWTEIINENILKRYHYNTFKLAEDIAGAMFAPKVYNNIRELISSSPFDGNYDLIYNSCLFDALGKVLHEIDNKTKIIITEVNDELLYELSRNPNFLYNLSPYDFERVIARMFEKKGFTVKITPQTRDGGKDIFIAKNDLCSFLFYVECKKYAPNQYVGIDVIQRLYGVISAEKATGGIIATTSYFTKPAKDYIQEHQLEHQLTLQDYNAISQILKSLQYKYNN